MAPPTTVGPTGCSASSRDVATPKLPPPPRIAQNRSGFSDEDARKTEPSAVTISADSRLSHVRPCLRTRWPTPPPSANPPTPVLDTRPPVVASPCGCVAASKSFHLVPPPATARSASTSTWTEFMSARSITMPSSHVENPAMLCAPPRTAIGSPSLRAKRTVRTTSCVFFGRTTSAGCLSIAWFQTRRAVSYSASPGRMTVPASPPSSSLTVASPRTCAMGFLLGKVVTQDAKHAGFAGSLQRGEPSLPAGDLYGQAPVGPDERSRGVAEKHLHHGEIDAGQRDARHVTGTFHHQHGLTPMRSIGLAVTCACSEARLSAQRYF